MNYFIAHRGLHKNTSDENTLESFQKTINSPFYEGFECDVRMTLDKVFVIHHNAFIGPYLIGKTKYRVLKNKYNLLVLEDVLKLNTNKIMLLEIKEINLDIKNFLKVINKYKKKNIYIMSFYNNVINKLKIKGCLFKLGVLNYIFNSENNYCNYDFIVLLESVVSDKLVKYFKEHNILVFVYGIRNLKKINSINSKLYLIVDDIL